MKAKFWLVISLGFILVGLYYVAPIVLAWNPCNGGVQGKCPV